MVTPNDRKNQSFPRLLFSLAVYVVGASLVIGGFLVLLWVGRPYAALYLSGKKAHLEELVRTGEVEGDRLVIPAVLVDAKLVEGATIENLRDGVAHVSGSAQPGAPGNAIVKGHNYAQFGGDDAFFSLLHLVRNGSPIYLYKDGRKFQYKVVGKTVRDVKSPRLYESSESERLTLITCASDLSSLSMVSPTKRIIVTARPVK
ncbi:MAG: sortase [Terriglobia bacterium]